MNEDEQLELFDGSELAIDYDKELVINDIMDSLEEMVQREESKQEPEPLPQEEEEYRPPYELDIVHELNDKSLLATNPRDGMAAIIARDNYFLTDGFSGELFCYINQGQNAGIYIEATNSIDWAVKQIAIKHDKGNWFSQRGKSREVYDWINRGLRILENPDIRHINVANGLVYLSPKGEFMHHSVEWTPTYMTTIKLPVSYDPEARCPIWELFIADIFPKDSQHIAWELAALLMIPLKNKAASAIILKGEKNTGKTTFQNALMAFLGDSNVSSLGLHQFGERFQDVVLKGKLANVVGELPQNRLSAKAMNVIKQLIGNDWLSGELKHGKTFKFKSYARCLFSCNDMPTCDNDPAFFDRFNIIPFGRTFDKNPIKEAWLNGALSDPQELSGLLNKALEALPNVVANGIKATPSMKRQHEEVVEENDPLNNLKEYIELGPYTVSCTELHNYYMKLEGGDYARRSNSSFGRALRKVFPSLIRKQLMINGVRTMSYMGLRIIDKPDDVGFIGEDLGIVQEDSTYDPNDPSLLDLSKNEG